MENEWWWEPFHTPDHASSAKVFRITDLPPLQVVSTLPIPLQIAQYFQKLITDAHRLQDRDCILLPSLGSLVQNFNVRASDIQNALHEMRKGGFECFIPGLYGPITLWWGRVNQVQQTHIPHGY